MYHHAPLTCYEPPKEDMNELIIAQYRMYKNPLDTGKKYAHDPEEENRQCINFLTENCLLVYKSVNYDELWETLGLNQFYSFFSPTNVNFHYDDQNRRIPYFSGRRLNFIRLLPEHTQASGFITSLRLLNSNALITPKRIQLLSDVTIGNPSTLFAKVDYSSTVTTIANTASIISPDFKYDQVRYNQPVLSLDTMKYLPRDVRIFVNNCDLEDFLDEYVDELNNRIIITHSCTPVPHNRAIHLNINDVKQTNFHQYSSNCTLSHERLTTVPLGLRYGLSTAYSTAFETVRKMNIMKTRDVYFGFDIAENPSARNICAKVLNEKFNPNQNMNSNMSEFKSISVVDEEHEHDQLNELPWLWSWACNAKSSYEEWKVYFTELASHKYAICPQGAGRDTHFLWECIYLDVIPIMIKADYVHIAGLPIQYLESWECLDLTSLQCEFPEQNLERVTFTYYSNEMKKFDYRYTKEEKEKKDNDERIRHEEEQQARLIGKSKEEVEEEQRQRRLLTEQIEITKTEKAERESMGGEDNDVEVDEIEEQYVSGVDENGAPIYATRSRSISRCSSRCGSRSNSFCGLDELAELNGIIGGHIGDNMEDIAKEDRWDFAKVLNVPPEAIPPSSRCSSRCSSRAPSRCTSPSNDDLKV